MKRIIIIAGATASGKSRVAAEMAQAQNGAIINADAMQLYRELRIITARPGVEEENTVPHKLYGVLPASEASSAGKWLALAKQAIEQSWGEGRLPIVVGGTGLYLKTLMEGIAPIPDVPEEVRNNVRARMEKQGANTLHGELAARDPAMAAKLKPSDTQRITRTLEVLEATGKSLSEWQAAVAQPPYEKESFEVHKLDVPREELYARCDARFDAMMQEGAPEEVKALLALELSSTLPAMRAVGVPELAAYIKGEISLDEAVAKAKQATRNYAKRQVTWLKHQLSTSDIIAN